MKCGVIGYGGQFNMGRHHLAEMRTAGMVPAAVADVDPVRLKIAAEDYPGIETYRSVDEMLKRSDVDLVSIITPHNTHADLAIRCLEAGKHIVCEKPFAITTDECDAMIAAARAGGLTLSTYHNRHWDGCILHALRTIRSGVIGEVVRVEAHFAGWHNPGDWWRASRSISGGVLYDWGAHLVEYTLQIVDSDVVEVSGATRSGVWASQTVWKDDTIEDEGFVFVRYRNGVWSSMLVSHTSPRTYDSWIDITGTKGSYSFDHGIWTLVVPGNGTTVTTTGKNPESEGWRYYQNIAAHVGKGDDLVITPEWARRVIHIIDLACKSAETGTSLNPKYP